MSYMKKWKLTLTSFTQQLGGTLFLESVPHETEAITLLGSDDFDRLLTEEEFDLLVAKMKEEYFSRPVEQLRYM